MTSLFALFEAAMRVKSMYDKIMIENKKKRKYFFKHKLPSKRCLGMEFTA